MKFKIKLAAYLLIIFLFICKLSIKAHTYILDVQYDPCIQSIFEDGEDEVWYYHSLPINFDYDSEIYTIQMQYHISQNVTTITYFVSETAKDDPSYCWDSDVTEEEALRLKNSYINSLLRWNDIYYYTYNELVLELLIKL